MYKIVHTSYGKIELFPLTLLVGANHTGKNHCKEQIKDFFKFSGARSISSYKNFYGIEYVLLGSKKTNASFFSKPEIIGLDNHGILTFTDGLIKLSKKQRCIIETNHELFLLRLRRRLAEGEIDPKRVGVYYFGTDGARRLKFGRNGHLKRTETYPDDLYNEAFEEAMALMEAQI